MTQSHKILYHSRFVSACLQQEFIKLGGTLLDCHQVTEIIPGDSVTVVTNRGSFKTRNVVIAAGPWAPALCSSIGVHLPFKVRTEYRYTFSDAGHLQGSSDRGQLLEG